MLFVATTMTSCGAHAQPTSWQADISGADWQEDVQECPAATLQKEDLAPYFSTERMLSALNALNQERGRDVIGDLETEAHERSTTSQGAYTRFALAYAYVQAERWSDAIVWLQGCVHELPLVEDYCHYWLAQAYMHDNDYARGVEAAKAVDRDAVYGPRAWFLYGQLLRISGESQEAVKELEAFIKRYPHAFYRSDVDFELAEAYIAEEAWDKAGTILHQLEIQNPGRSIEREAAARRESITSKLSLEARLRFEKTSARDRLKKAQALFNRHQSKDVITLLAGELKRMEVGGSEYCEANYLVGRSYSKLREHGAAAPYYDAILDTCKDVDLRRDALFHAGRSYWNAGDYATAITRYDTLAQEYAQHSFADDALYNIAMILRSQGKKDESNAMLKKQIKKYPDGDMAKDAIWIQLRELLDHNQWKDAVAYIDEIGEDTGENDIYSRGRLQYFKGRALEAQRLRNEASVVYQRVIRDVPLSWYALLAFNRLDAIDPSAVERLVDELRQVAGIQNDMIVLQPPEMAQDSSMQRGLFFLRLGLVSLASGEFSKLEDRYASQPTVTQTVARLLDASKAWSVSHREGASRIQNATHYPADDSVEDWTIAYPRPFDEHVQLFAQERGLDAFLIDAVMREESGFSPGIESWANALGLMQLMLPTAQDMAKLTGRGTVRRADLFRPDVNIELGSMYLRKLADRFEGNPVCMIAGYNGGSGNVNNWLQSHGREDVDMWVEKIPYKQTRHYVKRVAMSWWIYHWLYDADSPVVGIPQRMPQP